MSKQQNQKSSSKNTDQKKQREQKLGLLLRKIQRMNESKDLKAALTEPWDY